MAKFKIIEESRFLRKNDMANVKGSQCDLPHGTCQGVPGTAYEICKVGVAPSYTVTACHNWLGLCSGGASLECCMPSRLNSCDQNHAVVVIVPHL